MTLPRLRRRFNVCRYRNPWPLSIALSALVISGCGDGFASVRGVVTLDGKPMACGPDVNGMVQFYPEDGAGAMATGYIDDQGQFSLSTGSNGGVQPGRYVVTISATQVIPPEMPGEAAGGRRITPPQYADPRQSGWHVEVTPSGNTFDFNMESQP